MYSRRNMALSNRYFVPTCWCPKCQCFVGVTVEGKCEGCYDVICFLQDFNNNYEIQEAEMLR